MISLCERIVPSVVSLSCRAVVIASVWDFSVIICDSKAFVTPESSAKVCLVIECATSLEIDFILSILSFKSSISSDISPRLATARSSKDVSLL